MFAQLDAGQAGRGRITRYFLAALLGIAVACLALALAAPALANEPQEPPAAPEGRPDPADAAGESACGLGLDLPEGAELLTRGKDRAYWMKGYDDGGMLLVAVGAYAWSGQDDDLAQYVDGAVASFAAVNEGSVAHEGAWVTYGQVRAYAAGCVEADGIMLVAATATGDETATRLLMRYTGPDVAGVSAGDMAAVLESLRVEYDPYASEPKRGRIMYYDLLNLLGLSGPQILEVVEGDWHLDYIESDAVRAWMGPDGGPLDAQGCELLFVVRGVPGYNPADAEPYASREALEGDVALVGAQVQWYGVPPIEWDEPSDAAKALQKECGFSNVLHEGYTADWAAGGGFAWARVGACQVDGEDAFWLIQVLSAGEGQQCLVTVSVDLLDNGYGGDYVESSGFANYDEVVEALFG